jgi:hypothetical protein
MIQNSMYDDQPRWMSEGLAMSLAAAPTQVRKRAYPARGSDEEKALVRGVFTDLAAWTGGPSSDTREALRYTMSQYAIDYLRAGGFSCPNLRLNVLMGKLSRKIPAGQALTQIYGRDLRQLDQDLVRWLTTEK